MKSTKLIIKWISYILCIPLLYIIISLILTYIPVNTGSIDDTYSNEIYLSTNGVHVDIVIPKESISSELWKDLDADVSTKFITFGWGDENFYLNTPTWGDLKFSTAISALFLKSSTLMHTTNYHYKAENWTKVKVTKSQLEKINSYIFKTFKVENNHKLRIKDSSYGYGDNFYKANGSYSCIKTCNSWANSCLKTSGVKACLWTPVDFGLLNKHQ